MCDGDAWSESVTKPRASCFVRRVSMDGHAAIFFPVSVGIDGRMGWSGDVGEVRTAKGGCVDVFTTPRSDYWDGGIVHPLGVCVTRTGCPTE